MKDDTHDTPTDFSFKSAKEKKISNKLQPTTNAEIKQVQNVNECVWDMRIILSIAVNRSHKQNEWQKMRRSKKINDIESKYIRTARPRPGIAKGMKAWVFFSKEPKSNTVRILLFNFGFTVW